MIGLDTNVIVAWIIEGRSRSLPPSEVYRVSHVALLELEWVLSRRLEYPKKAVILLLRRLVTSANVQVDRLTAVKAAVDDYASGGADFADFMIMRDNEAAGCQKTVTFDRKAARKPGFALLKDGEA